MTSTPDPVDHCGYNRNGTDANTHVSRILKSFPTPSERYYDLRLLPSINRRSYFGEVGDQCIMFHSNKICIITIGPSHPVIRDNKTISKIDFTFDGFEKIDRLSCKPKGKSKKGCQKLTKNSPICALICSDDSKYIITAGIGSKLMEVNEEVVARPELLKKKPLSDGYIAIVQPNDWKRMDELREALPKLGQSL